MKKLLMLIFTLMLLSGFAVADRGIDPVLETQGITLSTTIDAVGNLASSTDAQWRITDDEYGLSALPPLGLRELFNDEESGWWWTLGAAVYSSTYSEETYSNGLGLIAYDKELDVETGGQLAGQSNIEAVKQLGFVGVDGSRVYSDEMIFVDGVANPTLTNQTVLCVFAADEADWIAAYCNYAEAGSTIDMTTANVRTASNDRFIMPSGDYTVELNHDLQVSELVTGLPSTGTATAYMDVLIQEGRPNIYWIIPGELYDVSDVMMERIEFSESTSVDGDISLFEKLMHYDSGVRR
jgi:hypothetical protein